MLINNLLNTHCQASSSVNKLQASEISDYLQELPNWSKLTSDDIIQAKFQFKNYKQTMFFINAVAYICEQECHHPEITFGFNYCQIQLNTHDLAGLSINDFICAAKINRLIANHR